MSSPAEKSPKPRTTEVPAQPSSPMMNAQRQSESLASGTPTRGSDSVEKEAERVEDPPAPETAKAASKKGKKRAADEVSVSPTDRGTPTKPPTKKATSPAKLVQTTLFGTTPVEKRKSVWLNEAPIEHIERVERVASKRFLIVGHQIVEGPGNAPEFRFDLVGGTGTYKTIIKEVPSCDCPDAMFRGTICKHIIYVLIYVLKVPKELKYQQAFLPSELRKMRDSASPSFRIKTPIPQRDGTLKPFGEDCPVCFQKMFAGEDVATCKTSCGNHIHKDCIRAWVVASGNMTIRCFYCNVHRKNRTSEASSPS